MGKSEVGEMDGARGVVARVGDGHASGVAPSVLSVARSLKSPLSRARQMSFLGDFEGVVREIDNAILQAETLLAVADLRDGLFELEPVAVRAVVAEYASERVVVRYKNRAKLVSADRRLLAIVVRSLCEGGLAVGELGERILVEVRDAGGKVRVVVRDFGAVVRAMRPGDELREFVVRRCAEQMGGEVGCARHRDGMSWWVDLLPSRQGELF